MAEHNDTGTLGESLAERYLIEHGYAILERNWKYGKLEADIIAYMEGVIVFVEVKTRTQLQHGDPEESVGRNKQRAYIRLANAYVVEHGRDEEARFDIIAVEMSQTSYRISHIEDAFGITGQYL